MRRPSTARPSSSFARARSCARVGLVAALALACAARIASGDATADAAESAADLEHIQRIQRIYGAILPDQIEHISPRARIKSAAASGSMTAIWEALEHGERVECLDCIPIVEGLLYDADRRTREIAAWWLRRRIFGVFGEGQVYERALQTLQADADPIRRTYAAEALGELLSRPGIDAVALAAERDPDPRVRAAAASALGRLNDDGDGALSKALADDAPEVRLAALRAASRLNVFADLPAVVRLAGDGDAIVRRRAAELLGHLRAPEGVDGLLALATDPDADVRNAACHALGALRDPRARPILEDLAKGDPSALVRGQARIALRRL